jgi:hypothetical protein
MSWMFWELNHGRGKRIFLFFINVRLPLGPTQPSVQWVLGIFSLRIKRRGHEADHSFI